MARDPEQPLPTVDPVQRSRLAGTRSETQVGEHITVLAPGEATEGYEIFLQRGPEGTRMFADLAREIAPVNPDVGQLAEVGARHGLRVAV